MQSEPSRYRTSYSEALIAKAHFLTLPFLYDIREELELALRLDLINATPVYWSSDCWLPDGAKLPNVFAVPPFSYPSTVGFIWFERPIGLARQMRTDGTPVPPMHALLWRVMPPIPGASTPVALTALNREYGPIGAEFVNVRLGTPISVFDPGQGRLDNEATSNLEGVFEYCMEFMTSRVPGRVASLTANRAARKVAERAGMETPDVLIVQYRKTEPAAPTSTDDAEPRHFTTQFPVNGHWRMQRCGPGRQTIRRVWVHDYRKGPKDAPLAKPKTRLFTVVR